MAYVMPDEEELYLLALLDDPSGIDLAEFAWVDEEADDGCFRCWDIQWPWYSCEDRLQADQCARTVGKSNGIAMRAFAFAFNHPGSEMLITAPELNHLRPLTDLVEMRLLDTRLTNEMLPNVKGKGINRQPHWQVRFANGARIMSRLPNKDGKGVKGSIASDSLVLTSRGHIRADEVEVGDEVLTHRNRWRPVEEVLVGDAECVSIDGGGYRGMVVSWNHRMIGRRNRNPQRAVRLEPPTAVIVDDEELARRWYFASPTLFPSTKAEIPDWVRDDDALMRLAGWYVAEGNQGTNRASFTVHEREVDTLRSLADRLGFGFWSKHKQGLAWRVDIYGKALAAWLLENFGKRAEGKRLPVWLLGCDPLLQDAFLTAYLEGDGHHDVRVGKKDRWVAGTASRGLAVGLRLLGQAVGYACSMSYVDVKPNIMCAGPQRSWRVTFRDSRRNVVKDDSPWDWQKVRAVTELTGLRSVVTIRVAEDHSFVADGVLHHNQHPLILEADEMQDYPLSGWIELIETLKRGSKGSQWRAHGVPRGVRDKFYEITQEDSDWTVHRIMAMYRPTWSPEERAEKIKIYNGSRQNPDYRRNIYGDHGDATNPVFVISRLMACVDKNESSEYNTEVYTVLRITFEELLTDEHPRGRPLQSWVDLIPGMHRKGHQLAPKGYGGFYGGMDIGLTNHPTEILIFGQRLGLMKEHFDLLLRVHLQRIDEGDQRAVVAALFNWYGSSLKGFGVDRTGLGFPIFQGLKRTPFGARVHGYNFSEDVVVGYQDPPQGTDPRLIDPEDLEIKRNFIEFSTDALRNEWVDAKALTLPFDQELLTEWQGQNYVVVRSDANPYGTRRRYSEGSFHTLDAARCAIAARILPMVEAQAPTPQHGPVFEQFIGV